METQIITLSLPKDILRRVELLAARRQVAVSELLVNELEKLVRHEDGYASARERNLLLLNGGIDLGTYGELNVSRNKLHER